MGLYDRDYTHEPPPNGYVMRRPSSVVLWLIGINVAFWVANGVLTPNNALASWMSLHVYFDGTSTLTQPWMWWEFLTYGFAHAPYPDIWHILGNMLALFFLGRDIEERYGSKEFLRFYLVFVVVGGVVWTAITSAWYAMNPVSPELAAAAAARGIIGPSALGASGAVVGVVILYALNFPQRTLLIWGIIPIRAWLLGVLFVLMDVFGATKGSTGVAHSIHLSGAAVAFLYFYFKWNFGAIEQRLTSPFRSKKPNLKVYHPDDERPTHDATHDEAVDKILEKMSKQGPGSLTRKERKILDEASRRFKEKHRPD